MFVIYAFLNVKSGKEVQQTLPAICIKNDLEEHLFGFLKSANANKSYLYLLDENDHAWINEDVVEMIPDITQRCE